MYSKETQHYFIHTLLRAKAILLENHPVKMELFGKELTFRIDQDQKYLGDAGDAGGNNAHGRPFVQIQCDIPCNDTGKEETHNGRKFYLSPHMTDDEIFKTGYAAYKAFVEHEMMEGFTVTGVRFVDPHTDFKKILWVNAQGNKRNR